LDHENHETSENRETANADIYPAISRLVGDIASGRAENPILFHKQCCTGCNIITRIKSINTSYAVTDPEER